MNQYLRLLLLLHYLFHAVLVFLSPQATAQTTTDQNVLFDDCDPTVYYAPLTSKITPSRQQLSTLLRNTHRRSLPYTSSSQDDVWTALADLHPGQTIANSVRLIYTQTDVPVAFAGDPTVGWNREHLWPSSRGVSGVAFSDVHHVVPSDWNVNAARGNKYFGSCQTGGGTCRQPAHAEATNDTAASRQAFLPPASVRGDIARMMLYMDVRYEGHEGEADLYLTDCPGDDVSDTGMAFLSELLEWHQADPVDEAEIERNNRACANWQGNRNPFVDYPFFAEYLFGSPQSMPYDCDLDDPGAVSCVGPGAVMVIGVNSDNPDAIAMVAMEYLPAGMLLFATDNAWAPSNQDFTNTEGIIMLRVPEGGIARGTVFGFGQDVFTEWSWERIQGNFLLSMSGDTVLLYCRDNASGLHHIGGLSYGGYWDDRGGDSTKSALPAPLVNVSVTLFDHADNYRYVGTTRGDVNDVRDAIRDQANWRPSNDVRFTDFDEFSFRLSGSSSTTAQSNGSNNDESAAADAITAWSFLLLVGVAWMSACVIV